MGITPTWKSGIERHREDVVECVRYATANGIPLTARGGGTGRAGQGIGKGIILDFMRYMNQVLEIDPQKKWVRVQPGVILGRLNAVLKPQGKFFPIDPSTADYCALGGMIANNSSGPHERLRIDEIHGRSGRRGGPF